MVSILKISKQLHFVNIVGGFAVLKVYRCLTFVQDFVKFFLQY